jgi:hypothetical protein
MTLPYLPFRKLVLASRVIPPKIIPINAARLSNAELLRILHKGRHSNASAEWAVRTLQTSTLVVSMQCPEIIE